MLRPTQGWLQKGKLFFAVLWPLVITQVAQSLITLSDTAMSGRVHHDELAGVAIGVSLWLPISLGIGGVLMAAGPILGQLVGKGEPQPIAAMVMQAVYIAIALFGLIAIVGAVGLPALLRSMNLEPAVEAVAARYLAAIMYGALPFFLGFVLRSFINAQGFTNISMFTKLASIPVNIGLNYVLIFGKFGFPALGGAGAGYATAATYWLVALANVALVVGLPKMRAFGVFRKWPAPSWAAWREFLRLGVPMGVTLLLEVTLFSIVALLLGWQGFSTETIAAHQAAISVGLLMASVPLGIGAALTILVAYELGAGRRHDARQYRRLGLGSSLAFAAVSSVLLYVFREPVAYLYTTEPALVPLLTQFFLFVILFQFSDAAQMALQCTLRGYKDATVPFYIALVSYWGVGIGAGWLLSTWTPLGAFGYWLGIFAGLTVAAAGFYMRLRGLENKVELPA